MPGCQRTGLSAAMAPSISWVKRSSRQWPPLCNKLVIWWEPTPASGPGIQGQSSCFSSCTPKSRSQQPWRSPNRSKDLKIGQIARLVRRHPGPMGEELVLPWAIADPERYLEPNVEPLDVEPFEALTEAIVQARTLTADVWAGPKPSAADRAAEALRMIRGDDPDRALLSLSGLRVPDPKRAIEAILGLLAAARHGLVRAGAVSRPELGWHISRLRRRWQSCGRAPQARCELASDSIGGSRSTPPW